MSTNDKNGELVPSNVPPAFANWLRVVSGYVSSVKFGTVQIVIHDSRVTEVVRSERVRFDRGSAARSEPEIME